MAPVNEHENLILHCFNTRNAEAFVSVYQHFFTDLYLYASHLYAKTSESPEDAVQDVFCYLWKNTTISFDNCLKLKAFLYTAIRNKFLNYLDHRKVRQKYENEQNRSDEKFVQDITKNEIYGYLSECLRLLPKKHAEVIELYLAAYEPEEIAQKLNLNLQTVYNIKSLSISILKEKLCGRDL